MSSSPERSAGSPGPLQYAPRWARETPKQDAGAAAPTAKDAPWRDLDTAANDALGEDGDRSPRLLVRPVAEPLPELRTRSWSAKGLALLGQTVLVVLVSTAAAVLVTRYVTQESGEQPARSGAPTVAAAVPLASVVVETAPPAAPAAPAAASLRGAASDQAAAPESAAPAATVVATTTLAPPEPPVRGVSASEIRFGIAAAFSGPARELGRQMKLGIDTAFNVTNANGGVHGRQLRLIAADDGYEPGRTSEAMRQLYEKDQVFGIVGNVGTPTATVALPYALERRMLFYGAFTGAGLLRRDPPDRYVFNYRASYAEETAAVVRYLVKVRRIRPEQIAVFAQQDSYGDAGFGGVTKAMRALRGGDGGVTLRLNYKRNTTDVEEALNQLRASKIPIKAVVMVATYRAAAKFIEKTRDAYPDMTYTNVSFVGSTELANELMLLGPRYASGVIVTQVVPALDGYSSIVLDYKSALGKYFPGEAPDYVSLEGFVTARVLIEALKRTGARLDTEKLVDGFESLRGLDLGLGAAIDFGRNEHQASHRIWGTQIDQNGRYQEIDMQ
jgi:branched-chain amino acid transport system substrate-binding protein